MGTLLIKEAISTWKNSPLLYQLVLVFLVLDCPQTSINRPQSAVEKPKEIQPAQVYSKKRIKCLR